MIGRMCVFFSTVLAVTVLVVGCGRNTSATSTDRTLARNLIDAVYVGSLTSVKDSLDPPFLRSMPDSVTAGTGALLQADFGAVKEMTLDSSSSIQQGWTETVWTVHAQRGSFQVKITRTPNEAVGGLWLRPSSAHQWSSATEVGMLYTKRQQRPSGW